MGFLERAAGLAWEYREVFGSGIWLTIQLSLIAIALSVFIGLGAALASIARLRVIRLPAIFVVEFCRDTPILVLVVWVHFAVPEMIGVKYPAYVSAVIALTMECSGFLAEQYRAGIESIDRGQYEAGRSLGMTNGRIMRRVILPQAIRRIVPGMLNQFVITFKSTSVVSVIAVQDLMYEAGVIVNETFLPMHIYTIAAMYYFGLVLLTSSVARVLTRGLAATRRGDRLAVAA